MLTTLTGGLTIGSRREVVGAIGVHGNSPERDEVLAGVGRDAALNGSKSESIRESTPARSASPATATREPPT